MCAARAVDDALDAIALLTVLPRGSSATPRAPHSGVAAWFPGVGLLLGAVAWLSVHALRAAGWTGGASLVVGALVVTVWALGTRLLHWDGLADVADGLWGGHTPARRLEIMADSTVGAFGAAVLVLVGVVQIASVGALAEAGNELPLLAAPALARLAATCAAWLGSPARESGLGRTVMGRPTLIDIVVCSAFVVVSAGVLVFGYGVWGAVLAAVAVVLALGVPHVVSMPVGGVTGDVMGASVMICEALVLAAAAMMWGA